MQAKNVVKTYKTSSGEVHALKGVSFDLPNSGMVFVLGKSGCGKSTLLNVLSGLDNFDGGDIIYGGKSIKNFTQSELDGYRNSCCGFVFQEYNLIPELNVKDNVALAIEMQGEKGVEGKVAEALKKVGLGGYESRKITELSGGQKQRIAIARSIVKEPKIIFADEPSGALDSDTGESIFTLLKELSQNTLVIVVSHDKEFAQRYGDRIIELSDGKVVSDSSQGYVNEQSDKVAYKKPRMPFKSALKIGCSNFKYHPVRLLATIILAVFSFTFLGVALSFSTISVVKPFVDAMCEDGYEYVMVDKRLSYVADDKFALEDIFNFNNDYEKNKLVTKADVELLQQYTDEELLLLYRREVYHVYDIPPIEDDRKSEDGLTAEERAAWDEYQRNYVGIICRSYSGIMSIGKKTLQKTGYKLFGRLAENDNEVVISEQHYRYFEYWGFRDGNGNTKEINEMSDMIGIELNIGRMGKKVITGILSTDCSKECYATNHPYKTYIDHNGQIHEGTLTTNPEFYMYDNECVFHEKVYVSQDCLLDFVKADAERNEIYASYLHILAPVSPDKADFTNLTEFILSYNNHGANVSDTFYAFDEDNAVADYLGSVIITSNVLSVMALYVSIIFFVFTVLLLLNYITTSVRGQMKQIGVISALGAGRKQLYKTYALSTLIVCGIVCILSFVTVGLCVGWLNATAWQGFWFNVTGRQFTVLSLNFVTTLALAAISVLTALFGTWLALRKMRKMMPVEIIRKGLIK